MPQQNSSTYTVAHNPLTNNILLIVFGLFLVVASFTIGSLYTRVKTLEESQSLTNLVANADAGLAGAAAPAEYGSAGEVEALRDNDHVRGDRDARILLIEYSDLECPYCKSFHPTAQQIVDSYDGQVAWVYRHFPLSFHQNAQKEAEASECVRELGGETAFWDFIDTIYQRTTANGTGFALTALGPLAAEVGVNQSQFQSCLDSNKYAQYVQDDMAGGSAAGVTGTPGNILLDTQSGKTVLIPGALPFAQFQQEIDELLAS